jgi:hypothetical protein
MSTHALQSYCCPCGAAFTLGFVPTRNLGRFLAIPQPMLHIFYHRRVADIGDTVPKVEGYWASEWAVGKALFKNLVRGAT